MYKSIIFCFLSSYVICLPSILCQVDFEFSYMTDDVDDGSKKYFFDLKDIDNDGDLDVVSSSVNGNTIAWNENIDGFGEFGEPKIVDDNDVGSYSIEGVDLDGDGDMDILASLFMLNSPFLSEIVWYENLNSEGEFSSRKILINGESDIRKVSAIDIDNDGDLDIIYIQDDIPSSCYVLINSEGLYEKRQLFESQNALWDFIFEDINDDGFNDIIVAGNEAISIIQNVGNGEFLPEKQITDLSYGFSIKAFDLDNDGDLDLVTTKVANSIVLLENLGGINFTISDMFSFGIGNYTDVVGLDLNDDDLIDLCVPTFQGFHAIINSGLISDFSEENIFSQSMDFTGYKMKVADINLDSKEDIIACSIGKNNLGLYTNMTTPTSTVTHNPEKMHSYVIGNQLHMSTNVAIEKVRVYNSSGQLVLNSNYREVTDISMLISGIYFYQLQGEKQIYTGQFYVIK